MSNNPADVLYRFFANGDTAERNGYSMIGLMGALDDLRVEFEAWRRIGRTSDAEIFDGAVDRWTQAVYAIFGGQSGLWATSSAQPEAGDMGLLKMLSDKLDAVEPTFDEAKRESISNLVDAVLKAVQEDDSLPESLRIHIATIAVEVQRCLIDYEIQGDFKLSVAVERLLANIHIAEGQSSRSGVWTKVREEWVAPVVVGLIVSAPQVMLAIQAL